MASTLREGGTQFEFLPLRPDSTVEQVIRFRALISSINESNSPSWSENMDMGRADPKFMYQQYSRTISIQFMTAALYGGEHYVWLDTLNSLKEMTKPIYSPGRGFNGVLCNMILGDLFNVKGFLSNVDISIDNESPWRDDVPLYVTCNIQFRVIGDIRPNYKKSPGDLRTGKWARGIS